ncbi:hypothetical protein [Streptomyces sp. HD]|uniref:hypothetical protein n=1 Tax=Streptomyces sp. HD TaxID=3020892 RepID=UPI00232FAE57|nr:hypothetical protein [Streptomyces sp. HD]MDC0772811.1 hypothetical protein [Streptomyces sp. HD]
MAFGAEELRVLRRALALALHPDPASAEDVEDCLRLAESLDEAIREGARLRAFLVADLARYRAALPGTAAGYLTLLEEALTAGYHPTPDDLAALRALRSSPAAATLLDRCRPLADQDTRARPTIPASRTHLTALPGGLALPAQGATQDAAQDPARQPRKKPAEKPAAPKPGPGPAPTPGPEPTPAAPKPPRPIPTPGEVFPRRKPTPPPSNPPQQLAAG